MSQSFERGMEPAREAFRRRKVMTLGEVAEVLIYTNCLTAASISTVEAYLYKKYFELPAAPILLVRQAPRQPITHTPARPHPTLSGR